MSCSIIVCLSSHIATEKRRCPDDGLCQGILQSEPQLAYF